MKRVVFSILLLAAVATAGCAPRHDYYGRRGREMDDRDAWEIVRNDPCRYDEYQRFAHEHKNPDKRRQVVWQLARDGCSSAREYRYESRPPYEYDRDYER